MKLFIWGMVSGIALSIIKDIIKYYKNKNKKVN